MNVVTALCFSVAVSCDLCAKRFKMEKNMVLILGTVLDIYESTEKVSHTVRCEMVS
jgi:hypothetical protein